MYAKYRNNFLLDERGENKHFKELHPAIVAILYVHYFDKFVKTSRPLYLWSSTIRIYWKDGRRKVGVNFFFIDIFVQFSSRSFPSG